MLNQHFVRVGILGNVGRFVAVDGTRFPRGTRVICRTVRGLEVGEVLSQSEVQAKSHHDGELLRRLAVEDELLLSRLEKNKTDALQACADAMVQLGSPAILVDAEQLFDGKAIFFYFLGDVSPELEGITQNLAETYETKVQFRQFVENVNDGCGPGCGTDAAVGGGCASGSCSTCVVAQACSTQGE